MATISREQLARLAYQAGFRGDDIWKAVAIAGRESGYNPRAYNPNAGTGDKSYGLMQINMIGSMGESRRRALGINSNEALYDPLTNMRAAYMLYRGRDNSFYDWGGYKGRDPLYNTDPQAAQAAYRRAGGQVGGIGPDYATASTYAQPPLSFFNWQAHPELNQQYSSLSPHLAAFERWTTRHYGGTSAGDYAERNVMGGSSPSTHAFGAAWDWSPDDRADADKMIELVTANPGAFGIQAIHDYKNSRVWRVGREGDLGGGWQSQPVGSHDGQMGSSTHLHFETNPDVWNRTGRRNWKMMGAAARGVYSGGDGGGGRMAPLVPPERGQAMTALLRRMGINYPNAPTSAPLLAYLRGVGLNLATAQDLRRVSLSRIRTNARAGRQDIRRAAGRAKEGVTADLVSRNVLGSGEANTRYARQAQDVAADRADLERQASQSREDTQLAYRQTRDTTRQEAIERVTEEDLRQQIEAGTNQVMTGGARRARRASVNQNTAAQQALQDQLDRQLELIRQYGQQGITV